MTLPLKRRAIKKQRATGGVGKVPKPGVKGDVTIPKHPVKFFPAKDPNGFQRPIRCVKLKRTKEQWKRKENEARKTSQRTVY